MKNDAGERQYINANSKAVIKRLVYDHKRRLQNRRRQRDGGIIDNKSLTEVLRMRHRVLYGGVFLCSKVTVQFRHFALKPTKRIVYEKSGRAVHQVDGKLDAVVSVFI